MAYNKELADRIRILLNNSNELSEREMFGGIGFMLHGNMACGVIADNLIVRVGQQAYESALAEPHTRVFDFTGRPMNGWVQITPLGLKDNEALAKWVSAGLDFARSLPPK